MNNGNSYSALRIAGLALLGSGAIAISLFAWNRLTGADRTPLTDDAYISADSALIAPKIAGFVAEILVQDNQPVTSGQLLARIDDRDFQTALNAARAGVRKADAGLQHARAAMQEQQALIAQAQANRKAAEADSKFAQQDQSRYRGLVQDGAASLQSAQQAEARAQGSQAHLDFARAALLAAQRKLTVMDSECEQASSVLELARVDQDKAELNLSYTRITAPFAGVVAQRALRQGAFVNAGAPLLAVVPVDKMYVLAHYRETQLAQMRPGQVALVSIDSWPGLRLRAHVDSIAPATGLEFAPIKPANASGNFTKVVQRIPVKIVFEPGQSQLTALRAGMSAVVTVDTLDKERSPLLAAGGVQ